MLASWHFEWIRTMVVSGHVCVALALDSWWCVSLSSGFLLVHRLSSGLCLRLVGGLCSQHLFPVRVSINTHALHARPATLTPPRGLCLCLLSRVTGTLMELQHGGLCVLVWLPCGTVDLLHCDVRAVDWGVTTLFLPVGLLVSGVLQGWHRDWLESSCSCVECYL